MGRRWVSLKAPRSRSRIFSYSLLVSVPSLICLGLIFPQRARLAGAPVLLTRTNSTRAIALDSINKVSEPFGPTRPIAFGTDSHTRLMLFATNLTLLPNETAAAVTADAEDGNHLHYPLTVE